MDIAGLGGVQCWVGCRERSVKCSGLGFPGAGIQHSADKAQMRSFQVLLRATIGSLRGWSVGVTTVPCSWEDPSVGVTLELPKIQEDLPISSSDVGSLWMTSPSLVALLTELIGQSPNLGHSSKCHLI